ncbi:MAG: DUF2070 family protein [Candidatus ainarchaeum sp.]|nr:DUF2070 family protein [Candidatus ainarchaeum sp.]
MGNMKQAVNLTNAFISLPKAEYLLSLMLIIGILFGTLAFIIQLRGQIALEGVFQGALEGLFLLSIPAILTSLLIKLMIRKIPFRRILAASLAGQIIYALAYFAYSFLISSAFPYREAVVFFAASIAFAVWFIIARFVFVLKWRSFLFASLQVIIYGVFLISGSIVAVSGDPIWIIGKFFLASAIFLGFVYLFFMIVNAPMKKNLGLNTLDAVSLFLAHWFYESKDIETEFERVGEEAETLLSAFIFKRKSGTCAFLIPYVHYGPFGSLGGSNFSYLLSEGLKKRHGLDAFVFHGTVTHDLNPVASSEMDKIISAFDEEYAKCKPSASSISLSRGFSEECFSESLLFRNCAFSSISRAPQTTEDVNFGLGLAIMAEAEKHIPMVSLIDQHNAETGDITSFEPGSAVGFRYMRAVVDSLSRKSGKSRLELGFSQKSIQLPQVGLAGIKVAVFSTKPAYALILIDSNGVKPETREALMKAAKQAAKEKNLSVEVGIFTTDTHSVNRVRGVLNPLESESALLDAVRDCVREAIDDIQPASFCSFKIPFRINVLGARQSIEIVSTVNAIVAVAKIAAPIIIIGSIISILWILSKV